MQMQPPGTGLSLRLLGPLALLRGGAALALPPSRKVRALLAYLALASRPASRSQLCELLWDLPSDPRGELRWSLSKLRSLLDEPGRPRVLAEGDGVALDLADCSVDALEVAQALKQGVAGLSADRLQALAALFASSDFLEGMDLPRSPVFTGWLVGERRRFRAAHAAVLEHWARSLPTDSDNLLAALEQWTAVAPFDRQAHEGLLQALAARGLLREGEEHLAATARRYQAEGQDWAPIGHAWRAARSGQAKGLVSSTSMVTSTGRPTSQAVPASTARAGGRASLAVMPFIDRSASVPLRGGLADGMAHDVITRLAKLRNMFVIAEGTMFALADRHVAAEDAGRRLDVDYVASGTLRREADGRLTVTVQLVQARTAQVVWADEFHGPLDDTFAVVDEIGNRIVAAIDSEIDVAERNRAILKNPDSLDAWEAHHRGLWHMVRFHREDNAQARHFFQVAARLDPTFGRPHAGLSFTHFQDAFLGWRDRDESIEQAYAAAAEGVMADERDPASRWALGRAMWLKNRQDEAFGELRSAIALSPNFAMGHYTLAFVNAQVGDAEAAIVESDRARALSPMDPMLFAMLATRALALMRLGRYEEAADFGVRSVARPNAHVHIRAIAMVCLALAGRTRDANEMAVAIRREHPHYRIDDFRHAFRLGPQADGLVQQAARVIQA